MALLWGVDCERGGAHHVRISPLESMPETDDGRCCAADTDGLKLGQVRGQGGFRYVRTHTGRTWQAARRVRTANFFRRERTMSIFGNNREKREAWAENEVALGLQLMQGPEVTNDQLRQAAQHFQAALTVITPSAYPEQSARVRAALDSVQETIARRNSFLDEAAKRFGWSAEDVARVRRNVDSGSTR